MSIQPNYMPNSVAASLNATPAAAPKGWFSRNWKWFVPTLTMFFFIMPLAFLRSIFAAMPATEQAGVIQTQETTYPGVVAEFTECRRKEGVLNIKVRFRNTSDKPVLVEVFHNHGEKYYVTAKNKKYFILKDSEGAYLADDFSEVVPPGGSHTWWVKYPGPPADIKKITMMTSITAPFEDVPITDQ
jgi:hypothetical protein